MNKFPCPCCGAETIKQPRMYDVCTICYWEDDPDQYEDPNDDLGANTLSLNQYRLQWQSTQQPKQDKKTAVAV